MLCGLAVAVSNVDEVIKLLEVQKHPLEAKASLMIIGGKSKN